MKLNYFFIIFLLSGCAATTPATVTSPYYVIPKGSTLILNEALEISAGSAAVFFQNGKIEHEKNIDQYRANFKFEIRTIKEEQQVIKPDIFTIIRTQKLEELVSLPIMLAAKGAMSGYNGGSPLAENDITEIYLHSVKQPDVLRLSCMHWEDVSDAKHLTVKQIRATLGKYITLKLNK